MHKNYLRKLNQIKNVYLDHCFHNEKNKERLKNVLKGDLKVLFGIKGSLYIYGHKHSPISLGNKVAVCIRDIMKSGLNESNLPQIQALMASPDFQKILVYYQKDKEEIMKIIKSSHISKIGMEATDESITTGKDNTEYYYAFYGLIGNGLLDKKAISDFFLVAFGPVRYLYLKGLLEGIEIFGAEGEMLSKTIDAVKEANNKVEKIDVEGNALAAYTALGDALKLNFHERNSKISENIRQNIGDNVLLVIGANHTKPIQELMPKDRKVKTKSVKINDL